MKKSKTIISSIIIIMLYIMCLSIVSSADSAICPEPCLNTKASLIRTSYLVTTENGYMRVYYKDKIHIEYYDNDLNILSKQVLELELNIWGGFYKTDDAYYIVEGQNNEEEDNSKEVIRIIKYDHEWNRIGAASITSSVDSDLYSYGEIRYPFDVGNVNFAESNGNLYIVTGHEGYVDPRYGQGHQGFLMIGVNENSMTGEIVDADLWHSFSQYIESESNELYVLEQSEGSRCTQLSKYNTEPFSCEYCIPVYKYGGTHTSAWSIACYASVDDLALSSDNILGIGTSIDQDEYDNVNEDTAHNIYLTVTPKNNISYEATSVKWLTNFAGEGKCFTNLKLTKINNERFMVSWAEYRASNSDDYEAKDIGDCLSGNKLHYIFIDGSGNKLSSEFVQDATMSECKPIVNGGEVIFYTSNGNTLDFYKINSQSGQFSKNVYRVAGDDITWALDNNGFLEFSGKGRISVDINPDFLIPLSSTRRSFSYSTSQNAWRPVRDKVKKISITGDVSGIDERQFNYFSELNEVSISSKLNDIGKAAFAYDNSLRKVYIPATVTAIGEDAFWCGYYTYGDEKIVRATIYTYIDSYAETYALENNIKLILNINGAEISGIDTNYNYTGREVKPIPTIKVRGASLTEGVDYELSYSNNIDKGTAAITISGIGKYYDSVKKTFTISVKRGDVNGDGFLNMKDQALLQRYLNDTSVVIRRKYSDMNNDGRLNMRDLAILQRLLNGWDV